MATQKPSPVYETSRGRQDSDSMHCLQGTQDQVLGRTTVPLLYVQDLERRLELQGQTYTITDDRRVTPAASWQSDEADANSSAAGSLSAIRDSQNGMDMTEAAIETDMVLSSSSTFSTHIKAISGNAPLLTSRPRGRPSKLSDNAYGLLQQPDKVRPPNIIDWPTEEESQQLVYTVTNSIGNIQHLFDPRSFSDRLAAFYDREQSATVHGISTAEILMVFAVGKLLQGVIDENEPFPGFKFFSEALKYVSNLCHVHAAGALGVEVMGLIAFYLQCADRKDDAYLYAGMGLRIAILMGLHRNSDASIMRSEKNHRNRLWWTIYMQERRLAAATGNPPGIQDEAITANYPEDFPGFASPAPLTVNITVAKTTGQILQIIYGQKAQTQQSFIKGVQGILVSLHQISTSMPQELILEFSDKPLAVTRTNATLYLMLYQTIMLATRPTLLYLAGKIVKGQGNEETPSQTLHQFAKTCIDAAQRSLAILRTLQHQQLIANFGFFDLDAIFSAAFVFVLAGTIYPNKESCWRDINLALDVLDQLSLHGNKASSNRRADILQMCDHLGISREQVAHTAPVEPTSTSAVEHIQPNAHIAVPAMEQPIQDNTTPLNFSEPALNWVNNIDELLLEQDPHDFYSLYCNDGLPLAGTVETDWEALERQIFC
ncbi:hypothetical protein BDW59DRAFT_161222 [Aspergillus cavernicola]|uniref:Xylanolytic transcriptional activator regulatory domain-containing protein n=1 Tax=Aspergillus cavernicola TaxID=176166 RepID=A0ABR4IEQ9_9EURO